MLDGGEGRVSISVKVAVAWMAGWGLVGCAGEARLPQCHGAWQPVNAPVMSPAASTAPSVRPSEEIGDGT